MASLTGAEIPLAALRSGRKIFAIAIAFSFLCNLLRLTGPLFILLVYDRVLSSGSEETLVVLFTLVVAFLITMGMVDYARRRLLARFGAQFQERMEEQIFRSTPKEGFFKTSQVKPASGLSDVDSIRGFFHSDAIIAVLDVFWAPLFLAVVFVFHWKLGLVVLGGIALLTALYYVKETTSGGRADRARVASKDIADLKDMLLTSKHVLKSQAMTSSFNDRWLRARRSSRDSAIGLKDWTAWFSIFSRQIKMLLQYSVLAVGAYLTIQGETTVGAMITSMFLSVRVFVPVEQFLKELPGITHVFNNWKFLKTSFASKKEILEHRELWNLEPSLTVTNLSQRSSLTGQLILRSINLTAEPGTIIEIVGASGAGKTVLAETILGALPITAGSIICGGANFERLSLRQATDMFAYIPETVRLVDGTIVENIAGLAAEPDIERALSTPPRAPLHEMILGLPDGYQTRIKSGHDGLAKGHRHQIAFARALYKQARILIIDEPDPFLQKVLSDDIKKVLENTQTIIIVLSTEPVWSLQPDQKYLLEEGRLKVNKASENVVRIEKRNLSQKSKNRASD